MTVETLLALLLLALVLGAFGRRLAFLLQGDEPFSATEIRLALDDFFAQQNHQEAVYFFDLMRAPTGRLTLHRREKTGILEVRRDFELGLKKVCYNRTNKQFIFLYLEPQTDL